MADGPATTLTDAEIDRLADDLTEWLDARDLRPTQAAGLLITVAYRLIATRCYPLTDYSAEQTVMDAIGALKHHVGSPPKTT